MVKGQKLQTPTDPDEAEEYHARRKKNNDSARECRKRKEEKIKECDEWKKRCAHFERRSAELESENLRLKHALHLQQGPAAHHHESYRIAYPDVRAHEYPQHSAPSAHPHAYHPYRHSNQPYYLDQSYQPNNASMGGHNVPHNVFSGNQLQYQPHQQHANSTRGSLTSFSSSDDSTGSSTRCSPIHNPYLSLQQFQSPTQPAQRFLSGFLATDPSSYPPNDEEDNDRPGDFDLGNYTAREQRPNDQQATSGSSSAKDTLTPCSQFLRQQSAAGAGLPELQVNDEDMLSPLFESVTINDTAAPHSAHAPGSH